MEKTMLEIWHKNSSEYLWQGAVYQPYNGGGIRVANNARLGDSCIIGPSCIIGTKRSAKDVPTIGNNVEICMGAKLYGTLTVGDNAIIAPNSVVIKDVPANAIVSGVPAKNVKFK